MRSHEINDGQRTDADPKNRLCISQFQLRPAPSPPGNCGAFARLVSPGGGALANLARRGGRAFVNPGDNPGKFVDVLKGMFSQF